MEVDNFRRTFFDRRRIFAIFEFQVWGKNNFSVPLIFHQSFEERPSYFEFRPRRSDVRREGATSSNVFEDWKICFRRWPSFFDVPAPKSEVFLPSTIFYVERAKNLFLRIVHFSVKNSWTLTFLLLPISCPSDPPSSSFSAFRRFRFSDRWSTLKTGPKVEVGLCSSLHCFP